MIVKKHISKNGLLLAVCDEEILGKVFSEGKLQLDLSGKFYDGEVRDEMATMELMKSSYIINLAGEKSLKCAKDLGIVDDENILFIEGIPHAQIVFVNP